MFLNTLHPKTPLLLQGCFALHGKNKRATKSRLRLFNADRRLWNNEARFPAAVRREHETQKQALGSVG